MIAALLCRDMSSTVANGGGGIKTTRARGSPCEVNLLPVEGYIKTQAKRKRER